MVKDQVQAVKETSSKQATKETQKEKDDNIAQQRKGRIVIRNLVYDVSEKHLKGLFSKFGEIDDINMPLNPSTNKSKGFAFIQFKNKNCALKAINELNGTKWKGRSIVLDLAVSKTDFKQATGKTEEDKPAAKDEKKKANTEENHDEEENDDDEDDDEEEDDDDEDDDEEDDEDEEDGEEEDDEEEQEEKAPKAKKEEKKEKKRLFENEDLSMTCFVRNLSYDISDKELREFCQTFGKVEMAKVCMNHETGNNKGTGFVKFKDADIARKLISKSDEYSANYLKNKHNKNIHDVFSGVSELDLEMNGRRIIFLEAKKRDDVARFMEEKNERNSITLGSVKSLSQLEVFDRSQKRNIHLAKLGIFEEENSMTPEQKEKRRLHLEEKITKLKNPNNQVSTTRIALMNLPKEEFQEEEIKVYAQAALVSEFGKDYIKKQNPIKQVLLLRDKHKNDKEGIPKSRGIGFVEFNTHEEALAFLEYAVKDKLNFERKHKRTPIIEFSIEDIRKMQKKNKLKEKVQNKQKERKADQKPKTKADREGNKLILTNANNAAKFKITQILEGTDSTDLSKYDDARSCLNDIQSRGLKQRLAKMLKAKFNLAPESSTVPDVGKALQESDEKFAERRTREDKRKLLLKKKFQDEKAQKKLEVKKKQQVEENELDLEASELIKAVQQELKKNKYKKQVKEDHDDLDDVLEKHLQKKVKRTKMESSDL